MLHTLTTPSRRTRLIACRPVRALVTCGAVLGLMMLTGVGTRASADDDQPKTDWWCGVIKKQLDRNDEEARKGHDSAGTERLREERRRLEKDYEDHHCNGR
jgi:hypothetical protein